MTIRLFALSALLIVGLSAPIVAAAGGLAQGSPGLGGFASGIHGSPGLGGFASGIHGSPGLGGFAASVPYAPNRVPETLSYGGVSSIGGCLPLNNNCYRSGWGWRCPTFGWSYYPVFLPSYGYYGGVDDTYVSTLQDQNALLQQQVNLLQQQNQQLQQPGQQAKGQAGTVPPGTQTNARARQTRAKQMTAAGSKLFTAGQYRKAAERFRDATRAVADDPSPHFFLGQSLFASKQYSQAIQAIKNGLKLNPEWLHLDFDMKKLYGDPNDVTKQLGELAKELQANPLDREALFLLGFELFVTGQKDKARTILSQAAKLETNDTYLKPFFDYFAKHGVDNAAPVAKGPNPPPPKPIPAIPQ